MTLEALWVREIKTYLISKLWAHNRIVNDEVINFKGPSINL